MYTNAKSMIHTHFTWFNHVTVSSVQVHPYSEYDTVYDPCARIEIKPKVIVRDRETILERVVAYKKIYETVNAIESIAFYDGYYLAVGFAAGSCKSTYCYKVECSALKGERCRHELKVRPSMEAVGIDVYKLATSVGWDVYPIGSDCDPRDVSKASLMGLVLVY